MTRAGLPALLALLVACATAGERTAPPADPQAAPLSLRPALLEEAPALLAELIRAKPVSGAEAAALERVAARLQRAGIEVETAVFAEGEDGRPRSNLLARLPGPEGAAPLLVTAHLDVVPAEAAEWQDPPFGGVVRGDRLTGRGSLDMLHRVVLDALALVALSEQQAERPPPRPIWWLLVGDEERNGLGMRAALERWPELTTAAAALGEGGFIVQDLFTAGADAGAVSVAEKGLLLARLKTRGDSGHGSSPGALNAPARLVRALDRVLTREQRPRLVEETRRMAREVAEAQGGVRELLVRVPGVLELAGPGLFDDSGAPALVRDTCALTRVSAGYADNVVPREAEAVLDCRLLPGTDPREFRDQLLLRIDDPRVELEVIDAIAASGSRVDHPAVVALEARLAEAGVQRTLRILTPGATDNRFLRAAGVPSFGASPLRISAAELERIHGRDESLRVSELERALPLWVKILASVAAAELEGAR